MFAFGSDYRDSSQQFAIQAQRPRRSWRLLGVQILAFIIVILLLLLLERERLARNLIFKEWITCRGATATGFTFADDPRWLPSYAPGTFQFRRTVVIVPYARPIPQGSEVVAEVCVMPWRKYLQQIVWEHNGKFSLWK